MSEDIVERLERWPNMCPDAIDGANEIKRLRKQNAILRAKLELVRGGLEKVRDYEAQGFAGDATTGEPDDR